jgi:hypothetical protein
MIGSFRISGRETDDTKNGNVHSVDEKSAREDTDSVKRDPSRDFVANPLVDRDISIRRLDYVYVGCDLNPEGSLALKIGLTNDCKQRLRQYRTVLPDYFFVIVVETDDARGLESTIHEHFAHKRRRGSEIFDDVAPVEVEIFLRSLGYKRSRNNLFAKNT